MIGALVLAAGSSRRMMRNKLRLLYQGKPLIAHVVLAAEAAHLEPILVVTGHEAPEVHALLADYPVDWVHNVDHASGMASSLKAGIKALPRDVEGVLVCLGDMPLVTGAVMREIVEGFAPAEGFDICVPTFEGQWGNPVLLGRRLFPEIDSLEGDRGARRLFAAHPEKIREVPVRNAAILTDIDTMDAYAKIVGEAPP